VQTADEQILPNGTAYLSDAGFTGPHDGCLGREIEPVIKRFVTGMPQRFEVARNQVKLHGAIIRVDDETGKAMSIQRVSESLN
jgi:calcineurin-like phosphoesterase